MGVHFFRKTTENKGNKKNLCAKFNKFLSLAKFTRLKLENETLYKQLKKITCELKKVKNKSIGNEELVPTSELVAGVAHEIRNPLSVIGMTAQYLEIKLPKNSPLREFVIAIKNKVNKLDKVSKDLINYAKPKELNLEAGDLHKNIDSILNLIKPKCEIQKVKIIKKFDKNLPDLIVNHILIDEVFTNIANNALDAMPKGGKLIISTKYNKEENIVVIKITNTGKEMCKKELSSLFKPFFTTKKDGTGLGLSIVKNIIEKHNGIITCKSVLKGKNRGTTFIIKLPISPI